MGFKSRKNKTVNVKTRLGRTPPYPDIGLLSAYLADTLLRRRVPFLLRPQNINQTIARHVVDPVFSYFRDWG